MPTPSNTSALNAQKIGQLRCATQTAGFLECLRAIHLRMRACRGTWHFGFTLEARVASLPLTVHVQSYNQARRCLGTDAMAGATRRIAPATAIQSHDALLSRLDFAEVGPLIGSLGRSRGVNLYVCKGGRCVALIPACLAKATRMSRT